MYCTTGKTSQWMIFRSEMVTLDKKEELLHHGKETNLSPKNIIFCAELTSNEY